MPRRRKAQPDWSLPATLVRYLRAEYPVAEAAIGKYTGDINGVEQDDGWHISMTPLGIVACRGFMASLQALLRAYPDGAIDPNQPVGFGATFPLHLAAGHRGPMLHGLLCAFPTVALDAVDKHGYTALWVAATRGLLHNVQLLLDAGANPLACKPCAVALERSDRYSPHPAVVEIRTHVMFTARRGPWVGVCVALGRGNVACCASSSACMLPAVLGDARMHVLADPAGFAGCSVDYRPGSELAQLVAMFL